MQFHAGANYSKSEAAFDPIQMPGVSQEVLDAIEAGYYDYSMINNYSDLDYAYTQLNLGTEYRFSKGVAFTLDVDYYNLDDNQGWVFGNETGSFYIVRTGFRLMNLGF